MRNDKHYFKYGIKRNMFLSLGFLPFIVAELWQDLQPLQKVVMGEVSWPVKMKIINQINSRKSISSMWNTSKTYTGPFGDKLTQSDDKEIPYDTKANSDDSETISVNDKSNTYDTETKLNSKLYSGNAALKLDNSPNNRRFDLKALDTVPIVSGRRQESDNEDDNRIMKIKLIRLMYETVLACDLKVKRAELIRRQYVSSPAFEVGFLIGDVIDKFDIMNDISSTINRLYDDWKPLEFINAYEQIANQAVEIGHIIEMVNNAAVENTVTTVAATTDHKSEEEKADEEKPDGEKADDKADDDKADYDNSSPIPTTIAATAKAKDILKSNNVTPK